jgi:uncharacterized membrane protein
MNSSRANGGPAHLAGLGRFAFAAILIWLGVMGLMKGSFTQVWQPVPKWVPAQEPLAYLCAIITLTSGLGLLWRRTAAAASRVIFASLAIWLVMMRLPNLFYEKPLVLVAWSFGATAVMAAAAWVLYIGLAGERDRGRVGFIADGRGLRIARALYGASLIPFGLAHFMYLDATTVLIPSWLPWHAALAYFTGATFIAAGLALIFGVLAGPAAVLSTVQVALFGLIVWVPRWLAGPLNAFQWGEFISNWALMAGGWVIADSFAQHASPSVWARLFPWAKGEAGRGVVTPAQRGSETLWR